MRQQELRLGLVLYGGVSLAVYMHGVTRELLNLQRASAALQQWRRDRERGGETKPELEGSAKTYFELLESFSPELDLRVVIDAISGASAGGVNAVMLARALSHDLPLKHHSDLWLALADVKELTPSGSGFSRYVKRALAPAIDGFLHWLGMEIPEDKETRRKLRQFISTRWFRPPFSGERYTRWLIEACQAMDLSDKGETLIPFGQRLELFVTLTDFHGVLRRIAVHDPDYIEELDHRRIVTFRASHRVDGLRSELGSENIPDLVFAARATSSFPGAFPPMHAGEMDNVLAGKDLQWTRRDAFLAKTLKANCNAEDERVFIDGSLVMNKPFQPLIDSIAHRPAAREVVRRLLYLDPLPFSHRDLPEAHEPPGFFKSIFASLSHIPRSEPIGDELEEIEQINLKVRRVQEVADAALPLVKIEVRKILSDYGALPSNEHGFFDMRIRSENASMTQSGFANAGYLQLRVGHLSHRLVQLMDDLTDLDGPECLEKGMLPEFWSWDDVEDTVVKALTYAADGADARDHLLTLEELRGLDVDYRIRQLRFLIGQVNKFYHHDEILDNAELAQHLDAFKRDLYDQVSNLQNRWSDEFYGDETAGLSRLMRSGASHLESVKYVLDVFRSRMGLSDLDRLTDSIVFEGVAALGRTQAAQEILESYIGFSFFDTSMFPVQQALDAFELRKIEVGRISPKDAPLLSPGGVELKGAQLQAFGAFFNRRWREHDYLWGRLNASERLVRLLRDVAQQTLPERERLLPQEDSYLHSLFLDVLEEEEGHLEDRDGLIQSCRDKVAAIYGHAIPHT